MISVKGAISNLDRHEQELEQQRRFSRNCLQWWSGSLQAVEEHVFPLFPDAAKKAEEDWQQVHSCLQEDAPEELLDSTPRLVERVLHNYAQNSRRAQREDLDAVKAVLGVLADAATMARSRTDTYGGVFLGVSESLGRLVQLENPDDLRSQLSQEAKHLGETVSKMVAETEASLVSMEADLKHFQERLAKAEAAASTDPLTGLSNRRELERQLELRINARSPFCALLFDLDGFKSINDRFGHACGDQVLRLFGAVLNEQVRPGDVVARWGGDEFFVIFDCSLKDALRRSQQISAKLTRRYDLECNGKAISLPIHASSGVVEYCCGETAAQLFERADRAMYAVKAKNTKPVAD
jgi:diguanylate cyclase